jgi:aldose 1-epimerase
MFAVFTKVENGFDTIVLQDNNNQSRVEVIPSCGAILHAFTVLHKGKLLNIIDSYTSKKSFDEEMEAQGFKSAKLSPYVCRMKAGEYRFGQKNYKVHKYYLGENAIHGLIYDAPFEVIQQEAGEEKALVKMLFHYKGTDAGYPFMYDCSVQYELKKNSSLTISTTIINKDAGIIPLCDGWHPYFSFGGSIDDCQLEFQSKEILEFDASLIPTGKLIPYPEFGSLKKIGTTFLDNCFTVNFAECQPMLILRDPQQQLQLEIRPGIAYPYLQLYTPSHRQSIAIENLSAAPDAFNNGMGLITLAAGEEASFTTNYTISTV